MISEESISLNQKKIQPIIIIWIIIAVVIGFAHQKFQDCKYRLPWLYIFLAYLLGTIIISQPFISTVYHRVPFTLIAISSLILIVVIHFLAQGSPFKYMAFLTWFIAMCFLLHPIILLAKQKNILYPVIGTVITLFTVLSVIAYYKPEFLSSSWGNVLFFALIGLLIVRIAFIFTKPSNQMIQLSAYFGIAIFSGFIMYDTNLAKMRADQCAIPFDYVENLIGLFLDIINLFSEMILARSSRRD